MHFIKKYKMHIIVCVCVVAALCFAFCAGDEVPAPTQTVTPSTSAVVVQEQGQTENHVVRKEEPSKSESIETTPALPMTQEQASIPASQPAPEVETAEEAAVEEKEESLCCILSVRCDAALGNAGEKDAFLPQDGVIFEGNTVVFTDGESVFDVLLREMKRHNIPIEFSKSAIYQSVYIEGICNLYERDCGTLSGWIYKVNGETPGYDCSNFAVKAGDRIEWIYTCNLGRDV